MTKTKQTKHRATVQVLDGATGEVCEIIANVAANDEQEGQL